MSAWKGWIIPGVKAGFRTKKAAERHIWETNMVGVKPIRVGVPSPRPRKSNPTKAQKRLNASKRSKQKRMAAALRKYLQQQNPAVKTVGAKVEKLKGGVLKITPIKANAGGKFRWVVQRWDDGEWRRIDPSLDTKAKATRTAALWRRGGWKVRVVRSGAY